MKSKQILRPILMLGIFVLIITGMLFTYQSFKPDTTKGSKKITVEVVIPNEKTKEFTLYTDEEYLRQPLEKEKLIVGSESQYGLFIQEVNGHKADEAKQEWWCVTKDGKTLNTGVDTTPITNGDHFELTLTIGY